MKKLLVVVLFQFSWLVQYAQVMPEAFIGLLPSIPGDPCSEDTSGTTVFRAQMSRVSEQLSQELADRHRETEAKVEAAEPKMQENALKRTGISPELTQQMMALQEQKKNAANKAQRDAIDSRIKALADQMMQESANISMSEVENLKTMDKAGKTAWGTAYTTEKKAEVMAEPEKYQEQNAKNMKDYNLVKKQIALNDSIGAQQTKYAKKFMELDNNSAGKEILRNIADLEIQLDTLDARSNCNCEEEKKLIRHSIRDYYKSYCNLLSPLYIDILRQYETFTKASLLPLYRLEKLTHQVTFMQTGVDLKLQPGEMGLEQIRNYLAALGSYDKYNHIPPVEEYYGE